ncbi:alpha/beta hydrolase [Sphingomonas sp. MMS24-J13]|uniref:alpha/beta hydrolase n=1 Tax=Sphingomonas sp. MMS24-J13 TaxID=3238686 RepID=UPI0038517556
MMDEQTGSIGRRHLLAGATALLPLAAAPARALTPVPAAWRAAETLPLWPNDPPGHGFAPRALPADWSDAFVRNVARPALHVFRPARPNGRALLVIPGGSYVFVSIGNEGADVAREMTERGYTVFVLTYRLPGEGWADRADVPLQDAQRAMRIIRQRAAHYACDPAKLFVIGFSAGGHLAATLVTGFADPAYRPVDAADALDARPRAAALIYPVIAMTAPIGHADSTAALLGADPSVAAIARRSPAEHVGAATPPLFLVHALDDPAVSPQNTILMLEAMRGAHRPVECHLFQQGGHGFGLGAAGTPARQWPALLDAWLDGVP